MKHHWREGLPLRPSAYLRVICVEVVVNAENAEIRRGPQRKKDHFWTFCAKPLVTNLARSTLMPSFLSLR